MPDDLDQKVPAKKGKTASALSKYKWWIVGGLVAIALVVFFMTRNSASAGAATAGTAGTGVDPNTGVPYATEFSSGMGGFGIPGSRGPAGPRGKKGKRGKPGKNATTKNHPSAPPKQQAQVGAPVFARTSNMHAQSASSLAFQNQIHPAATKMGRRAA